jgi:hypothetical protein
VPAKTAFENFRDLTKKVMSIPHDEIAKREIKYRAARKNKNRKRHR